jgi:hypothetical protein
MSEKIPDPLWDPLDLSDVVEGFMMTETKKKPKTTETDDQLLLFGHAEECITETGDE